VGSNRVDSQAVVYERIWRIDSLGQTNAEAVFAGFDSRSTMWPASGRRLKRRGDTALFATLLARPQSDRDGLQQIEGASAQGRRAHHCGPAAQNRSRGKGFHASGMQKFPASRRICSNVSGIRSKHENWSSTVRVEANDQHVAPSAAGATPNIHEGRTGSLPSWRP